MIKVALLVRLQAKPGKESEVEKFIQGALPLAEAEPDTISWYALKMENSNFGIFDTFPHNDGRSAHLAGKIAEALMANASELLAKDPVIEHVDVLAAKR
ncbi:MAG: antibiotic biosynthesis monooxygenase [Cyclobacteriaceae bacterium]